MSPSPTASPSASPTVTPSPTPTPTPSSTTTPPNPTKLTARHLVARATYGVTAAELAEAERLGPVGWLDRQLKPDTIPDPVGDAIDAAWPRTSQPVERLFDSNAYEVRMELAGRHLVRAAWGSRQLFEVMVDFWSNHLNVNLDSDQDVIWGRPEYDALIRKHTFGRFDAMLRETGVSSAMLLYLSNAGSEKRSPNENYAREVMELHTLGVDGGYSEADVKQLALLLTGWTAWYNDTDRLRARFDANRHHVGPITALGRTFANPTKESGPAMWTELANFLAHHDSTARYLATKLVRRFVSDEPNAALVSELAKVYLDNDTAIVPVLRALFGSADFAAAANRKVKRPLERYLATVRVLTSKPPADLKAAGLEMARRIPGQVPLSWAAPNGYPDMATAWQSPGNALDLFNRGANMLQGRADVLGIDGTARIVAAGPTTPPAVAAAASQVVLLSPPTKAESDAAVQLLTAAKLTGPYAAGSSQQRRAAEIAGAMFLATPAHLTR